MLLLLLLLLRQSGRTGQTYNASRGEMREDRRVLNNLTRVVIAIGSRRRRRKGIGGNTDCPPGLVRMSFIERNCKLIITKGAEYSSESEQETLKKNITPDFLGSLLPSERKERDSHTIQEGAARRWASAA